MIEYLFYYEPIHAISNQCTSAFFKQIANVHYGLSIYISCYLCFSKVYLKVDFGSRLRVAFAVDFAAKRIKSSMIWQFKPDYCWNKLLTFEINDEVN